MDADMLKKYEDTRQVLIQVWRKDLAAIQMPPLMAELFLVHHLEWSTARDGTELRAFSSAAKHWLNKEVNLRLIEVEPTRVSANTDNPEKQLMRTRNLP